MTDTWAQSPDVSVGGASGQITIVEGSTFCISGRTGDIRPFAAQGFFYEDARFVSQCELRINGYQIEPLTTAVDTPLVANFIARAHPNPGDIESTAIALRTRRVDRGLHEEIVIRNFAARDVTCTVDLTINADFLHIFLVKENRVPQPGEMTRQLRGNVLTITQPNGRERRSTEFAFTQHIEHTDVDSVFFTPTIPANGEWRLCFTVTAIVDGVRSEPRYKCGQLLDSDETEHFVQWRNKVPLITTNHIPLATAVRRGQEDLGSLRMFDVELSDRPVIAAGAPWYMTLFGRDSLITAWMALIVDSSLAIGVLEALAKFQGVDENAATEEQPGRILHEIRPGGGDLFGFDQSSVYYGSIDSTPLFVMLLGELRRWGLAPDLTERLLPHADRALEWIEKYGDLDGDGYVEYERMSPRGILNQGWKDSPDSSRFIDGTLAETPIALAEVQAYVFAAYQARKWFAREAGDHALAERYRAKAKALKSAFNRDFWMEEHGYFAMGLDRDKKQIDGLASNMGHCLWTGIVDDDKAAAVAEKLLSNEMFSGWGVRTLASNMRGFNPIGYHSGSVWPHDTAICAAGLSRYGFLDEVRKITLGLLDAALPVGGRLPELFSGLERSVLSVPVSFPTSCSPQAWAAASPLLLLRTLLRFDPSVPQGHIVLDPNLGDEISYLRLDRIPFDGQQISIEVLEGDVQVKGLRENIKVLRPHELHQHR